MYVTVLHEHHYYMGIRIVSTGASSHLSKSGLIWFDDISGILKRIFAKLLPVQAQKNFPVLLGISAL